MYWYIDNLSNSSMIYSAPQDTTSGLDPGTGRIDKATRGRRQISCRIADLHHTLNQRHPQLPVLLPLSWVCLLVAHLLKQLDRYNRLALGMLRHHSRVRNTAQLVRQIRNRIVGVIAQVDLRETVDGTLWCLGVDRVDVVLVLLLNNHILIPDRGSTVAAAGSLLDSGRNLQRLANRPSLALDREPMLHPDPLVIPCKDSARDRVLAEPRHLGLEEEDRLGKTHIKLVSMLPSGEE